MPPIDAFFVTVAIGSGLALTVFIFLMVHVVAVSSGDLLDAATAAFRRYAARDMVVTAYYDDKQMRYARRFELPEPYLVEMAKKHKETAK